MRIPPTRASLWPAAPEGAAAAIRGTGGRTILGKYTRDAPAIRAPLGGPRLNLRQHEMPPATRW
ncbi:hypothetical protein BLTE_01610 [Blastochloris tepida]|uniref:Uncharacterized protein n=1 Tax=Blastochloris tepida TaxID=2233851 RepID=A0A348FVZ3_9HYPH|nr:hypothetical protein BLTE_01610 [Blastochloris tepida]